jgi:hypothetical protein
VEYSLFIMAAVLVMFERLEKRPGMALVAFPPPIFIGLASISWFYVSPPPLRENASRSLYIGFLGQPRQSEIKMDDIGGTTAK